MTLRTVSFHGFGGAFAVACKEIELDLIAVVEPGAFGSDVVEHNREFLGFTGPIITDQEPDVIDNQVDILLGNPPCSSFSLLNTARGVNARGPQSGLTKCMHDLIRYSARLNGGKGPQVVIFESVQGAGRQGHDLMRSFRDELQRRTNRRWLMTRLFMSGAAVGSAQMRKRFFFVASQVPFGIEPPETVKVATYEDAIGDLEHVPLMVDVQEYFSAPSWWSVDKRWYDDVSGHPIIADHVEGGGPWPPRLWALDSYWPLGTGHRTALRNWMAVNDGPPPNWDIDGLMRNVYGRGFSGTFRVYPNEPGRVISGAGGYSYYHWSQPRTLTVREVARLMGFPDEMRFDYAKPSKAFMHLGKQVPVESWAWALKWVKSSILGLPGRYAGEFDTHHGEPEWTVDVTRDYQAVYHDRQRIHGVDGRSLDWKNRMEARGLGENSFDAHLLALQEGVRQPLELPETASSSD